MATRKAKAAPKAKAKKSAKGSAPKPENRSIVPAKYKARYGKAGTVGDELADALTAYCHGEDGISPMKIVEIGKQNGIDVLDRWGQRNLGQQRMNLGNVLRGRLKRGEYVRVGKDEWNVEAKGKKAA